MGYYTFVGRAALWRCWCFFRYSESCFVGGLVRHQSRQTRSKSKLCCSKPVYEEVEHKRDVWNSRQGIIMFGGFLSFLGFKEEEEEKEDPLISIMKLGILNMQREEYDKAESILHLALKLAQERADLQAQRYIYDLLANNAYQKGDFPKAEDLFIHVMKELLSSGMDINDNAIIEISLKLASIYSKQNQKQKAEEGFRFCTTVQEKKLAAINLDNVESLTEQEKDTVLLWAMSADWYAKHLLDTGKYSVAQTYFEKALDISEKINGPTHPQTLVLLNDLGSVASLRKDYEKALEYFEKAISLGTKTDTPDLPAFYCNRGATYLKKKDYNKANTSCSKALKLAKKFKNKEAENDASECLKELQNIQKVSPP